MLPRWEARPKVIRCSLPRQSTSSPTQPCSQQKQNRLLRISKNGSVEPRNRCNEPIRCRGRKEFLIFRRSPRGLGRICSCRGKGEKTIHHLSEALGSPTHFEWPTSTSAVLDPFLPGVAQVQPATKASSVTMSTSKICRPGRAVNNAHYHGHNIQLRVRSRSSRTWGRLGIRMSAKLSFGC